MRDIKHFRQYIPEKDLLEKYSVSDSQVLFLLSEDGQDWYDCQASFADDTVKIMYDSDGVIRAMVNTPVSQHDNIYAVSLLWPVDMSVAEISVDNCPADCQADGLWRYTDGRIEKIPTDDNAGAENKKSQLMADANAAIAPLERSVRLKMATDEEAERLNAWERYSVLLSRVKPEDAPDIAWPEKPE